MMAARWVLRVLHVCCGLPSMLDAPTACCQQQLAVPAVQRSQREQRLFQRQPDGDVEIPVRRPDGDVELQDAGKGFVVPPCMRCSGVLKPDVTFFGDAIPPARSAR